MRKVTSIAFVAALVLIPAAGLPSVSSGAPLGPALAPAGADPISFNIDPSHSSVGFRVRHLGLSRVSGTFSEFEGSFVYDPDNPSASSVTMSVNVASVDTGVERRDNHLRSADFFEVETYPTMTFRSASVRVVNADNLVITGDLTIHGVTKAVDFETEFLGMAPRRGGFTSAFEATTRINRHEYGLTWNNLQEGLQIVGDEIDITIQIEANTPRQQ